MEIKSLENLVLLITNALVIVVIQSMDDVLHMIQFLRTQFFVLSQVVKHVWPKSGV